MAATRPIRALVIGAGETTALLHLPVLAKLQDEGRVQLVEICDLRPERAAAARRRFGFSRESGDGFTAVEGRDIDAAYIFGSAQLHYDLGLAALEHGKHLFVEKPVAPSYAEARRLAQAAFAAGRIAVGGHNRRFFASLQAIRARAGGAGWRYAEAVFHKPALGRPAPFGARTWLGANGIHALDALVFMMGGLPEQMTALTGEGGAEPSAFSAVMQWADGAQGVFLCNNNAGSRREEYVFHGPGETCRATADSLAVERDAGRPGEATTLVGDGFAAEHTAFLGAIEQGGEPVHSLAAIAPSLWLAELIEAGFSGRLQPPAALPVEVRPATSSGPRSILVVQPARLQAALGALSPAHRLVSLEEVRASPGARPDVVAAILGPGSPPLPAEVLARLPGLTVVGVVALSLARHEPEALLARGVTLVNASAAYAESVAEFAFGLAILARRRAFLSHRVMRRGGGGTDSQAVGAMGVARRAARGLRPVLVALGLGPLMPALRRTAAPMLGTARGPTALARDLAGAVVGLVGWGANARVFTARLVGAGARVLVFSQHAAEADIRAAGARPASLAEVLAAEVVSLHRGLSPATRHGLGAAELARLRPGAILINIARGALIAPDALLARLRQGDIFACLDTFDEEPLPGSHPLRRLTNVFLTSHIAGGSPDMHAAAAAEVVGKVAARLKGEAVEAVSGARLATMT